ncbi:hypothetical protein BKA59DRAFT_167610 [Fusarium tricinctum]|uniref:Secreted protein n=1 Tax=Fusarium tricinctum TaxID=61284 RepID=A0A8K0S196_9HYPO|nr:hypothetical protein BKA59DRAFT_167610 [Fusarium tricinctum]
MANRVVLRLCLGCLGGAASQHLPTVCNCVAYLIIMLRCALRSRLFFSICRINLRVWGGARGLELVHGECGGSFWVSPVEESLFSCCDLQLNSGDALFSIRN